MTFKPEEPGSSYWPGYDVFISYSHHDKDMARKVKDLLKDRGLKIWFDEDKISPGANWSKCIREGIEKSKVCLVMLSDATAPSEPWVSSEWAAIQECAWRRPDLSICPVYLSNVETPAFLQDWKPLWLDRDSADANAAAEKIFVFLSHHRSKDTKNLGDALKPDVEKRFGEILHAVTALKKSSQDEK